MRRMRPAHGSTAAAERVSVSLHFDFTTVGHVTVDVLPDGSRRAGGTALYSALQASRLGLRALIVTRGLPSEIESLLAQFDDEIALIVQPSRQTTTLATTWEEGVRRQRVLSWAGPIELQAPLESPILHLAPIARELPAGWRGHDGFVGLTPQGLVRSWSELGAEMLTGHPDRSSLQVAKLSSAIVISEQERAGCAELISATLGTGGLVAIPAGASPTILLQSDQDPLKLEVARVDEPIDDLGAGNVYASALFIALYEGQEASSAASFASAAAAERMRGLGAEAIAHRGAVEARVAAQQASGR